MSIISILALFSCIFLGTEYLFVEIMATVTTSAGAVMAQNYILGASVVGFVLYPYIRGYMQTKKKVWWFVSSLLVILGLFVIYYHLAYGALLAAGILCYVIFGMWGSEVYYLASLIWDRDLHIARNVGIAYALGIGLQFINNNIIVNVAAQMAVIACGILLMMSLVLQQEKKSAVDFQDVAEDSANTGEKVFLHIENCRSAGIVLIVIVALMACVFATLDNAVTLVHADGHYDIGQLPRIILACSGLTAGFLFDLHKRRHMYMMMYGITVLSVISIVVLLLGNFFERGLFVFYLSAGFFVVFFSTAFIDLSYESDFPALWAGLGRAVNNASAVITSGYSVYMLRNSGGGIGASGAGPASVGRNQRLPLSLCE